MEQQLKLPLSDHKFKMLLLVILPVVLFTISVFFKSSKGEFYIGRYYDPSYAYLINSLNTVNGQSIGHFDHPGTPVQIIGAATLYFQKSGMSESEFTKLVFSDPERFLSVINMAFIVMISLSLFIFGYIVFVRSGNIITAMLLQLAPFSSVTIFYNMTNVSPEPMIIFSMLIFLSIVVGYIYESDDPKKKSFKYIYLLGFISGFLLSVKISVFPVMIVPLILLCGYKKKLVYLLISGLIFLIIIAITMSYENVLALVSLLKRIAVRSGAYGFGSQDMIVAESFFGNLKKIFYYDIYFVISYFTSLGSLIYIFSSGKSRTVNVKMLKLLVGIVLMMTLQLIIVSKHFQIYYMLPALMLSVPASILSIGIVFPLPERSYLRKAVLTVTFLMLCLPMKTLYSEISSYRGRKSEAHKIIDFAENNFADSTMFYSNISSGKIPALFMGIQHSGRSKEKYVYIMNELYPGKASFDIWLKDFDPKNTPAKDMTYNNKFIFQCSSTEAMNDLTNVLKQKYGKSEVSFTKLFSNIREESLYLVICN